MLAKCQTEGWALDFKLSKGWMLLAAIKHCSSETIPCWCVPFTTQLRSAPIACLSIPSCGKELGRSHINESTLWFHVTLTTASPSTVPSACTQPPPSDCLHSKVAGVWYLRLVGKRKRKLQEGRTSGDLKMGRRAVERDAKEGAKRDEEHGGY